MTQPRPVNVSGNQRSMLRHGVCTHRLRLSVLLMLIPIAIIPAYVSDFPMRQDNRLDEHPLGENDVNLCSLMLTVHGTQNTYKEAVEEAKRFTTSLNEHCSNGVKEIYLQVGKSIDQRTTANSIPERPTG